MSETTNTTRCMLPEPTLKRLPWYLAHVSLLRARGVETVSSTALSKELNVDSSQIAKDLSFLDIKGKTRIGYEVFELEQVLTDFLGFKKGHNAAMVGVGSLGAALMRDSGLLRYGLNVAVGFDIDPRLFGKEIGGIAVYDVEELPRRCRENDVEIAIIAVPIDSAQGVADLAVSAGIKAIWNFTPCRIRVGDDVAIQNTSIYSHLAVMYNRLDAQKGGAAR